MSNVHLPFVSVYQRMTDFVQTLAYASVIGNSVTGVLAIYPRPIMWGRSENRTHNPKILRDSKAGALTTAPCGWLLCFLRDFFNSQSKTEQFF